MQHEITRAIPLLDSEGNLTEPGYAKKLLPVYRRAACTAGKLIKSDQHQVFGRFTGKAVLDDGRVIEVRDFPGFAEKVENKW